MADIKEKPECFGQYLGSVGKQLCATGECSEIVFCKQQTFVLTRALQMRNTPAPVVPPAAFAVQVGGNHYKDMRIQPFEYIHANGIPFAEGCVIKYVSRWRNKSGLEDLRKARHFLDLLIAAEEARPE